MGHLPTCPRIGAGPECVLQDESTRPIPVRGRLWNRPTGPASGLFRPDHPDVACHRHLSGVGLVPRAAILVVRPDRSLAYRARPRAPSMAVAHGFFMGLDPDLCDPGRGGSAG